MIAILIQIIIYASDTTPNLPTKILPAKIA